MSSTIAAGDFKARCLKLLDEVAASREPLVITKHGRPVAKVVPIAAQGDLFGALAGSVRFETETDIVSPLDNEWEACR